MLWIDYLKWKSLDQKLSCGKLCKSTCMLQVATDPSRNAQTKRTDISITCKNFKKQNSWFKQLGVPIYLKLVLSFYFTGHCQIKSLKALRQRQTKPHNLITCLEKIALKGWILKEQTEKHVFVFEFICLQNKRKDLFPIQS